MTTPDDPGSTGDGTPPRESPWYAAPQAPSSESGWIRPQPMGNAPPVVGPTTGSVTESGTVSYPDPGQPASSGPPPTPRRPAPRRRPGRAFGIAGVVVGGLVLLGIVAGLVVHPGYDAILPGDAIPVSPRITVAHSVKTYKNATGDFFLLYVRERQHLNLGEYLWTRWFNDDATLVKSPPSTPDNQDEENGCAMDESQAIARKVALERLGYKVTTRPGVLVEQVLGSSRAAGIVHCNDVIRQVDGKPTNDPDTLRDVLATKRAGDQVPVLVDRDGKHQLLQVKLSQLENSTRAGIGVLVSQEFSYPVDVKIEMNDIGGPSAGLAMTLTLLDELTPGSLTGAQKVAVTGTIDPDGNVGEIGGIEQKAIAARRRGAKLFLVPACQEDPLKREQEAAWFGCVGDLVRAKERAGNGVEVVPVRTLAEALTVLADHGGAPVPAAPVTTTTTTRP